jgi:hypothetical protein
MIPEASERRAAKLKSHHCLQIDDGPPVERAVKLEPPSSQASIPVAPGRRPPERKPPIADEADRGAAAKRVAEQRRGGPMVQPGASM